MVATDFRLKMEQRASAYVSRKRMWRTLPEPSSICLECLRRKDCNAALLRVKSDLNILARLRNQRRLGPASASLVYTTSNGSS